MPNLLLILAIFGHYFKTIDIGVKNLYGKIYKHFHTFIIVISSSLLM